MPSSRNAGVSPVWKSIAVSSVGVIAGLVLLGVGSAEGYLQPREAGIVSAIGTAVIVAVGLNALFDFFGKRDLIREFTAEIRTELGRRLNGIIEAVDNAQHIEYSDSIWKSEHLTLGNRGSLRIIKNFSGHIAERARNGRKTTLIFCTVERFQSTYQNLADKSETPESIEKWVEDFLANEGVSKDSIKVVRTNELINYSFLSSDQGIWVKLYNNSKSRVPAPAFFVNRASTIGAAIQRDIDRLSAGMSGAK